MLLRCCEEAMQMMRFRKSVKYETQGVHSLAKHCGGIATKHGSAVLAAVSRFLHVWTSACHASAILRVKLNIEAAGS